MTPKDAAGRIGEASRTEPAMNWLCRCTGCPNDPRASAPLPVAPWIDEAQPPPPKPAPPSKDSGRPMPDRPPADRSAAIVSPRKSELGRRRYDWTPAPTDIDAI